MISRHFAKASILIICFVIVLLLLNAIVLPAGILAAPQPEEDVFAKGVQAYSAGDYAKAEKLLSTYLKNTPNSLIRDIGLLWYGRSLIALNRFADAEKVAESMEKEFPKSPLTRKLRSELETITKNKKSPQAEKAVSGRAEKEPLKKDKAAGKASTKQAEQKGASRTAKPQVERETAIQEAQVKKPTVAAERKQATAHEQAASKTPPIPGDTAKQKLKAPMPSAAQKAQSASSSSLAFPVKPEKQQKPQAPTMKQEAKLQPPEVSHTPKGVVPGTSSKVAKAVVTSPASTTKPSTPSAQRVVQPRKSKPKQGGLSGAEKGTTSQTAAKSTKKENKKQPREAASTEAEVGIRSRRDPFRPLVVRSSEEPPTSLAPGKKGLVISRLQIKGIVKTDSGSVALVQSGSSPVAIFLKEKDSLYDGEVMKIYDDRVVFKHLAVDKLGNAYQEEVTKRLSGSAMF